MLVYLGDLNRLYNTLTCLTESLWDRTAGGQCKLYTDTIPTPADVAAQGCSVELELSRINGFIYINAEKQRVGVRWEAVETRPLMKWEKQDAAFAYEGELSLGIWPLVGATEDVAVVQLSKDSPIYYIKEDFEPHTGHRLLCQLITFEDKKSTTESVTDEIIFNYHLRGMEGIFPYFLSNHAGLPAMIAEDGRFLDAEGEPITDSAFLAFAEKENLIDQVEEWHAWRLFYYRVVRNKGFDPKDASHVNMAGIVDLKEHLALEKDIDQVETELDKLGPDLKFFSAGDLDAHTELMKKRRELIDRRSPILSKLTVLLERY